jgi:hypothetical protein
MHGHMNVKKNRSNARTSEIAQEPDTRVNNKHTQNLLADLSPELWTPETHPWYTVLYASVEMAQELAMRKLERAWCFYFTWSCNIQKKSQKLCGPSCVSIAK